MLIAKSSIDIAKSAFLSQDWEKGESRYWAPVRLQLIQDHLSTLYEGIRERKLNPSYSYIDREELLIRLVRLEK